MKIPSLRRRELLGTVGLGVASTLTGRAFAQAKAYPNRPVKVIVPWAAGGAGDAIVRMVAPGMSKRLGQPIVIDNRPGAIGTIGSRAAASSPADGYTLLWGSADSHSIAPHLLKPQPYDAMRDFVAIAPAGYPPLALVVHPSHPAKTLEQFLDIAKAAKEPLTFASWGQGSSSHIIMEALKKATNTNLLHVPYNGSAPLAQAQLSDQVSCSLNSLAVVAPHLRSGGLRVLAITAKQRIAEFSDVPIMKERGIAIDMGPWLGFLAPANVPQDILETLHGAIDATLREPGIVEQMGKMTNIIEHMDQRSYQAFYTSEFERWGRYIRASKVTLA